MKEYLFYGQVQRRLDEHVARYGVPFSFFEAAQELWQEGAFRQAAQLPPVDFERWDVSDVSAFGRVFAAAPVDLDFFFQDFQTKSTAVASSRHIPMLDVLPMRIAANQAMGMHTHESFELLYVMRGSARFYLNSAPARHFGAGELCLVAPHFHHDILVEKGGEVISVSFAEHTVENTLYKLLRHENIVTDFLRASLSQGSRGYILFRAPPTITMLTLVRSICQEGYCRDAYAREICASYVEILFSYLLRSCARDYERYSEERSGGMPTPMVTILKYIQDNYKSATLHEVAALFHYEPNYLGKLIKSHMGKNYTQIVADLRMGEAKKLLRTSEESIEKISELTGFQSVVHFSRSFRKYMGMPPSAYRRSERGEENDNRKS